MSNDINRLTTISNNDTSNISIMGFNGQTSSPSAVGINEDGRKEYFVPHMPKDLVLLSAHSYAKDGAAILHENGGVVLRLTDQELKSLMDSVQQYPILKTLTVKNRTYEVNSNSHQHKETAFTNTATRYFNTKINVSNQTERVLTLLLTGLSFQDWYSHVQHGSMAGIPLDVTQQSLNKFERAYGRTPDIIRLSKPMKSKNQQGLMDTSDKLTYLGQRIEIDVMHPDFNDIFDLSTTNGNVKKVISAGNAVQLQYALIATRDSPMANFYLR